MIDEVFGPMASSTTARTFGSVKYLAISGGGFGSMLSTSPMTALRNSAAVRIAPWLLIQVNFQIKPTLHFISPT
jgi:hypothetical protein